MYIPMLYKQETLTGVGWNQAVFHLGTFANHSLHLPNYPVSTLARSLFFWYCPTNTEVQILIPPRDTLSFPYPLRYDREYLQLDLIRQTHLHAIVPQTYLKPQTRDIWDILTFSKVIDQSTLFPVANDRWLWATPSLDASVT